MSYWFFSFWWLIFPLMGFVFGGLGMYFNHRQQQRAMDLLKIYAEQGKDPPPEVMSAVNGGPGPWGGPYGGRWSGGWGWRGAYYGGPFWAWRRVFVFAALAIGFGSASQYADMGHGASHAFLLVAIIMAALFVGALLFAIMATIWRPK